MIDAPSLLEHWTDSSTVDESVKVVLRRLFCRLSADEADALTEMIEEMIYE